MGRDLQPAVKQQHKLHGQRDHHVWPARVEPGASTTPPYAEVVHTAETLINYPKTTSTTSGSRPTSPTAAEEHVQPRRVLRVLIVG
jgi:hypothetical protein